MIANTCYRIARKCGLDVDENSTKGDTVNRYSHYVIVQRSEKLLGQTSFGATSEAGARRFADELTKRGFTVERVVSYADFWGRPRKVAAWA